MTLLHTFGFVMVIFAGLRLLDIAWPTRVAPWPLYAVELAIGFCLMILSR